MGTSGTSARATGASGSTWSTRSRPTTSCPRTRSAHLGELKKALKAGSGDLILATDYDREGEAIAYHVATLLGVDPATAKRVTFTEITRDAILEAFGQPRAIDLQLYDAQEARRILDRLVGYRISPLLWKKVRPGLSAGRVQSVAVRLIVEREREIRAFVPVEYWSVDVRLTPDDGPTSRSPPGSPRCPRARSPRRPTRRACCSRPRPMPRRTSSGCVGPSYRVTNVEKKERKRSPAPPFTTSTLQQEAARKLGFAPARR